MKKFLGAASIVSSLTVAGSALAAPPAPMSNWGGFYAGLNGSLGGGTDPFSSSTLSGAGFPIIGAGTPLYTAYPPGTKIGLGGWGGGGQIGYNYQITPIWLAGVEADIQYSGIDGTANCLLACGSLITIVPTGRIAPFRAEFSNVSEKADLNWFGTVRGRFGYTAGTGGWGFFYFTGGLAYGDIERAGAVAGRSTNGGGGPTYNTFAGSYDNSSTQIGWTIGAGLESKLSTAWSLKVEYLYVDLGSMTDTFNTVYLPGSGFGATPGTVAAVRTDLNKFYENVFRFGVNYKLGN